MKERDIQNYLYAKPEVLFPTGDISEKAMEYSIKGKRIDLLLVVDGVRYIVEIKNVPIQREHIGQVVEYYGLMRHYMKDANLSMILVSSSIPPWRAAYLEELGIRCVEISYVPTTEDEHKSIQKKSKKYGKKANQKMYYNSLFGNEVGDFEDVAGPACPKGFVFAHRMLRESLEPIRKSFNNFDVVPFSITRPYSFDFDLEFDSARDHGTREFTRGGVWWAYRFGFSEDLPPNDVPNISVIANTTGLDVTLNAELQPSQKVLLNRIRESTSEFDRLLASHGKLWLKTHLKFEHQPRFYHWILADLMSPGEFGGATILRLRREHEKSFAEEREHWIYNIKEMNKELTKPLIQHLEARNKRLNMAVRLVESFPKNSAFWSLAFEQKVREIVASVQRMRALLKFFIVK